MKSAYSRAEFGIWTLMTTLCCYPKINASGIWQPNFWHYNEWYQSVFKSSSHITAILLKNFCAWYLQFRRRQFTEKHLVSCRDVKRERENGNQSICIALNCKQEYPFHFIYVFIVIVIDLTVFDSALRFGKIRQILPWLSPNIDTSNLPLLKIDLVKPQGTAGSTALQQQC